MATRIMNTLYYHKLWLSVLTAGLLAIYLAYLITSIIFFPDVENNNNEDLCKDVICDNTNPCVELSCIPTLGACVLSNVILGCCQEDSDCPQTLNTTFSSLCGLDNRCQLTEVNLTITQALTSNLDTVANTVKEINDILSTPERPQYYWTGFLAVDGITNLVQDYSVTPRNAWLDNPFNTSIVVYRMLVEILGPGSLTATEYGTIATLPNGVSITYEREDGELVDLTADSPIRRNVDWAAYAFNARPDTYGSGDNGFSISWEFNQGDPTGLTLLPGRKIRAMLRDNFTALTLHRFLIQGYVET